MSGIPNLLRKAKPAQPDDYSGIPTGKPSVRGAGGTDSFINSGVSPRFITGMSITILLLALCSSVSFVALYLQNSIGFHVPSQVEIFAFVCFIACHFLFLVGELVYNLEIRWRGLSVGLVWGTLGLTFLSGFWL